MKKTLLTVAVLILISCQGTSNVELPDNSFVIKKELKLKLDGLDCKYYDISIVEWSSIETIICENSQNYTTSYRNGKRTNSTSVILKNEMTKEDSINQKIDSLKRLVSP